MHTSLTVPELNAVLGALRWLQHCKMTEGANRPQWLEDIVTNCASGYCLSEGDIDALCEKLNNTNEPWDDDLLQFARLLEELQAAGAYTDQVMAQLQDSMDLEPENIYELMERARVRWEATKAAMLTKED